MSDFDNSGEPGPQAKGVNHLEVPLRQLHVTHRTSSCAKQGGHVQLCSKPRSARGIEPETFRTRGQLLSCPPTTGPCVHELSVLRRRGQAMKPRGSGSKATPHGRPRPGPPRRLQHRRARPPRLLQHRRARPPRRLGPRRRACNRPTSLS